MSIVHSYRLSVLAFRQLALQSLLNIYHIIIIIIDKPILHGVDVEAHFCVSGLIFFLKFLRIKKLCVILPLNLIVVFLNINI